MPSQKNIHQLAELVKHLTDSKATILTEYAGLSVTEQNELRSKATENNSLFTVAKNNLIKLALKEVDPDLVDTLSEELHGPTAVLFADDAASGAKVVMNFADDHDALKVKSGIMDGQVIDLAQITSLSKLPGRDELLAKLLAQLQAPAQALVRQLNAPMQNFVYGLNALKSKLATA